MAGETALDGEGADTPGWLARGRVPCLDGLRAVSIAGVLLCHSVEFPDSIFPRAVFTPLGKIGVEVFFGISGFLITLLLLRESRSTGTISLGKFYARRALRILPVYYAFLGAVFVITRLGWYVKMRTIDWAACLTYTANLIDGKPGMVTHLWSLSMEEQFYALWPPLLLALGVARGRAVLLGYLVVAPVLRVACRAALPGYRALAYTSPLDMESIVLGCLLALAAWDVRSRRRLDALLLGRHAGATLALCVAVVAASVAVRQRSPVFSLIAGNLITALSVAAALWVCVNRGRGAVGRFLEFGPVATLGVLSYSVYIWQQMLIGWTARWPVFCVASVLAGWASHRFLEAPFLRLKSRFEPRTPDPPATADEFGREPLAQHVGQAAEARPGLWSAARRAEPWRRFPPEALAPGRETRVVVGIGRPLVLELLPV